MDKEFNLVEVIRTILKWKMPIVIITIVAAVASALFSIFVMDEYFLSWSTFYPTNQAVFERSFIFNTEAASNVEYFGSKGDANRVLTIANSLPVAQYIIDSFKLADHYKIDKSSKYWATKVRKKFEKNYEAIKTENDAIKISLYDTDPVMAAAIIQAIVQRVDELNKEVVTSTKKKTYDAVSQEVIHYQTVLESYRDTLAILGERYKIKVGTGTDGTVIVEGNDYKAVQDYKSIMASQTGAQREVTNLITVRGQMDVAMQNKESSLHVVEPAVPADRREKPVRSVVVLITTLLTLFISIIGALLIEQIKEIKKQL